MLQPIHTGNVRDRSFEFGTIVDTLRARQSPLAVATASSSASGKRRPNPRSEFARAAAAIGHEINVTVGKLEKLTKLVKKKSLFDDRPVEIQELTYIVKQDLAALNLNIDRLRQLMVKQKGQVKASQQADDHSSSVVISLQSKLASTSTAFKDVLEMRTQNMKSQKDRRDQFSAGVTTAPLPSKMSTTSSGNSAGGLSTGSAGGSVSALYRRNEKSPTPGGNDFVAIDMGGSGSYSQQQQQQQMILAAPQQQDTYSESRLEEIQNIESTISQLGTIFQQLANLVQEQGDQIRRIDADIQDVEQNVDNAQKQLIKYLQSFGSNRSLMLKVFGVVLVFFIIFVVFFV